MGERCGLALGLAAALVLAGGAQAMTLGEAIAQAVRANPGFAQSQADADAAHARLDATNAGRLPTVTLTGQAAGGASDLGGFFGFGRSTVFPRQIALELRQPLYTGGAVSAAIDAARAARQAALFRVGGARAALATEVAEVYVAVVETRALSRLADTEVRQLTEIAGQAQLRFDAGEIARTDLAEAQARLAEARASEAQAAGAAAKAEARFVEVVGAPPDALAPLDAPPPAGMSQDAAIDAAAAASPALLAAEAQARAARDAVRGAQGERLPSVALTASAASVRDQFFPGYHADGFTVGVEGRWTLFSGGAAGARVAEAEAGVRAAEDALAAARGEVREAVVEAWQDVAVARTMADAARERAAAAAVALDSARQEVRVGQRPLLDLLDAERESIAADAAVTEAQGDRVVAAYRLAALTGAGRAADASAPP
jgi:TolC family type I secretion outer membrane protein